MSKSQSVAVCGIMVYSHGRILMMRRCAKRHIGLYEIPMGKIDVGETPEEGACRETFEEVNLKFNPKDLSLVYRNDNQESDSAPGTHYTLWIFKVDVSKALSGPAKISEPKIFDHMDWLPLASTTQPLSPIMEMLRTLK